MYFLTWINNKARSVVRYFSPGTQAVHDLESGELDVLVDASQEIDTTPPPFQQQIQFQSIRL